MGESKEVLYHLNLNEKAQQCTPTDPAKQNSSNMTDFSQYNVTVPQHGPGQMLDPALPQ